MRAFVGSSGRAKLTYEATSKSCSFDGKRDSFAEWLSPFARLLLTIPSRSSVSVPS